MSILLIHSSVYFMLILKPIFRSEGYAIIEVYDAKMCNNDEIFSVPLYLYFNDSLSCLFYVDPQRENIWLFVYFKLNSYSIKIKQRA